MSACFVVDWQCCLGAGGEGEVFLGRSLSSWELCAVKVSVFLDTGTARSQLARELDRCSRAAGDGVVGLIAWNLDAPRPFLVFELARAGTLADEMREVQRRGRTYHPLRALERVRDILVALGKVHERGLIHRDIKPANLLRFGRTVKLTDFGTGRTISRATLLETEGFVGTRAYAAPEQLAGEEVDERADLYSVGCILHELLTGTLPHDPEGLRAGRRQYPSPLVLPELDRLISTLLDPSPARRPASAHEAIRLVDHVLGSYGTARRAWQQLGLGPSPY